ncbi:choline dehydrogenase 7 [Perkinsus olseni]|uniref:Choline dehydrogenase 7 n=1 Tax=Perkinsus olseni TaxID=32597 RepID=A0A7J6TJM0_PEROL|nr:choline dehydrogenase 7 [Perkinsus olseni]
MSSVTANSDMNLSKQELEHLIKEGAYAAFEDHSSREEEFRSVSLDDIMSSDRIKTVTYGGVRGPSVEVLQGILRIRRLQRCYYCCDCAEEIATSPDSLESGEEETAEGGVVDGKLSDIDFWRKLVHDEALLTTDPDAKEEKSEPSVNDVGDKIRGQLPALWLIFDEVIWSSDKEDRIDQEYEPQEFLSDNGDSDVDVEDLIEEEVLDKEMKTSRMKKRGRGRRGKSIATSGLSGDPATVKEGVGRGGHKRVARVDISAATPSLQRAVAAAAAAQKAKASASASSCSYPSIPRRTATTGIPPQQQQHQQQQLPTTGVNSATYPYIPSPPQYPYAAVQYRGMPMPPHGLVNHNMPNSRLLFPPPPPMYQCAPNYGMIYGMYVASRTAAAAAAAATTTGERNLQHSSRPPVYPDELLTSVDLSKIERLD